MGQNCKIIVVIILGCQMTTLTLPNDKNVCLENDTIRKSKNNEQFTGMFLKW